MYTKDISIATTDGIFFIFKVVEHEKKLIVRGMFSGNTNICNVLCYKICGKTLKIPSNFPNSVNGCISKCEDINIDNIALAETVKNF